MNDAAMAELSDKREMRLEGQEAFELYVKEISRQLSAMMAQARELQAAIEEIKRKLSERAIVEAPQSPVDEAAGRGKGATPRD